MPSALLGFCVAAKSYAKHILRLKDVCFGFARLHVDKCEMARPSEKQHS